MARTARQKSEINTYFIYIKMQDSIRIDDATMIIMKNNLFRFSDVGCDILAYNIHSTGINLVLLERELDVTNFVRKITISSATLINNQLKRNGKVFKDRFSSVPASRIEDVFFMICAVHSFCKDGCSSERCYFSNRIVNPVFVSQYVSSQTAFSAMMRKMRNNTKVLKYCSKDYSDTDLIKYIEKTTGMAISEVKTLENDAVVKIISDVLKVTGISARKLALVCSFPLRLVWGVSKQITKNDDNWNVEKLINKNVSKTQTQNCKVGMECSQRN